MLKGKTVKGRQHERSYFQSDTSKFPQRSNVPEHRNRHPNNPLYNPTHSILLRKEMYHDTE